MRKVPPEENYPDEIVFEPRYERNATVYWEPIAPVKDSSVFVALLTLIWELTRLTFRATIWVLKWVLILAFYAVVFVFFMTVFTALIASHE